MDNTPIDEDYIVMKGSKKEQEVRYRDREAYKELKNEQRYRNAPVRKIPEGCGTFIIFSIIGLLIVTLIAILLTT